MKNGNLEWWWTETTKQLYMVFASKMMETIRYENSLSLCGILTASAVFFLVSGKQY